jgi:hypothetical protein
MGSHRRTSRWPAAIGLLAVGVAYGVLPDRLREGPRWLLPVVLAVFVALMLGAHSRGYLSVALWLSRAAPILITAALMGSVFLLVTTLPTSHVTGERLLVESALLWAINVLVFALWFWEIDGGGPHARDPESYERADFVFPQFQQDPGDAGSYWMPNFLDYLFLAFSTATSFGPTDTLVMSQRAKVLTMVETGLSVTILTILVARAIGLH